MNLEDIITYDKLLEECLNRVPNNVDKRQGSIIYDAIAPCCVELAQIYIKLYSAFQLCFVDSSVGESLDKLVNQNGIYRKPATKAIRQGEFNLIIPIGSRFSDGNVNYIVIENIEKTFNSKLECEETGNIGNEYYGDLTPITNISGISKAILTDIIDLGVNVESDSELKERYIEMVNAPSFGGNISDYRTKTKEIVGVGGCKVEPIWDGGGTVKLIITDSEYNVPTDSLISEVQEIIDPTKLGDGLGIAPIGHIVTVSKIENTNISAQGTFILESGISPTDIQNNANEVVDNYFKELSKDWENEEYITVRISQIENILLNLDGVIDLSNVKINNQTDNIKLNEYNKPLRNGDVVINE